MTTILIIVLPTVQAQNCFLGLLLRWHPAICIFTFDYMFLFHLMKSACIVFFSPFPTPSPLLWVYMCGSLWAVLYPSSSMHLIVSFVLSCVLFVEFVHLALCSLISNGFYAGMKKTKNFYQSEPNIYVSSSTLIFLFSLAYFASVPWWLVNALHGSFR